MEEIAETAKAGGTKKILSVMMTFALYGGKRLEAKDYDADKHKEKVTCAGTACGRGVYHDRGGTDRKDGTKVPPHFKIRPKANGHIEGCDIYALMGLQAKFRSVQRLEPPQSDASDAVANPAGTDLRIIFGGGAAGRSKVAQPDPTIFTDDSAVGGRRRRPGDGESGPRRLRSATAIENERRRIDPSAESPIPADDVTVQIDDTNTIIPWRKFFCDYNAGVGIRNVADRAKAGDLDHAMAFAATVSENAVERKDGYLLTCVAREIDAARYLLRIEFKNAKTTDLPQPGNVYIFAGRQVDYEEQTRSGILHRTLTLHVDATRWIAPSDAPSDDAAASALLERTRQARK